MANELIRRLAGDETLDREKIAVHQFSAALGEAKRGVTGLTDAGTINKAWLVATFGLDATEESQLETLITKIVADDFTREEFEDWFMLAEIGAYTVADIVSRIP